MSKRTRIEKHNFVGVFTNLASFPDASVLVNGIEVGDWGYNLDTKAVYICSNTAANTWRLVGPTLIAAGLVNGADGSMLSDLFGNLTPSVYTPGTGAYSFTITGGDSFDSMFIHVTLTTAQQAVVSAVATSSNTFAVNNDSIPTGAWGDYDFQISVFGVPTNIV